MRRELSSRFTFVYRWVIPGFLTLAAILVVWRFARIGMPGRAGTESVLVGVAIAVALMILARFFDKAKRVWVERNKLVVGHYGREFEVDLAAIDSVEATRLLPPSRVRVRFDRPTRLGDRIVFFPPIRWRSFSTPHPAVDELTRLARAAREGGV